MRVVAAWRFDSRRLWGRIGSDPLEPSLVAYMDAARLASDEVDRVERRKQSYIRPVQRLNAGP